MDKKPLILIIDDEKYVREMIELKLSVSGFETHEADCGRKGIEAIKELKPDIVLLDIEMPDMTGVEVLRELRKEGLSDMSKIFLYTGKDLDRADIVEVSRIMAKEEGAVDLIRKETNLDQVIKILKNCQLY